MPCARLWSLPVALLLSGCAGAQDAAVRHAAEEFGTALGSGRTEHACARLAPLTRAELESGTGAPCPRALARLGLRRADRVVEVQRYGHQASVRLAGPAPGGTWFLSRHGRAWLVSAAGCTPRGELPYDCELEGP